MSEHNETNALLKRMFASIYHDNNLSELREDVCDQLAIPPSALDEMLNPNCIETPTEKQVFELSKLAKEIAVRDIVDNVSLGLDQVDVQAQLIANTTDTQHMPQGWNQIFANTVQGIVTNCRKALVNF